MHSIVNLNINRGEAEHKKHGNILKTHLIVFPCFLWMCIRGPVDTRGMNMLPFFFGPWIECFNMDWMLLELAKLGWSLAEVVVDVYREVYCSLLCAVKCRCPGLAVYEYFCNHRYKLKNTFFYVYPRTIFFHPRNDNHDRLWHVFTCTKIFLEIERLKYAS